MLNKLPTLAYAFAAAIISVHSTSLVAQASNRGLNDEIRPSKSTPTQTKRPHKFDCNSKGHTKGDFDASVNGKDYPNYTECKQRRDKHKKLYPSHDCGCRPI